jgi:glycoprotease/Kae1 family metallohydrolase
MITLSFESTAHTAGISVVSSNGNILSEVRDLYTTKTGGIIPIEAANHHKKVFDSLIKKALEQAKNPKIDLISYSASPGLPPCLKVGLEKAKEMAKRLSIPIIGVNHAVAHLSSGTWLTKAKDPLYVYVSGANTQLIGFDGNKNFRVCGECLDTGMGNALDKFGRNIGIGFPAGPTIEKLAKKGSWTELPYVVKGMDLSFSGIVTSTITKFRKGISKEDLCYSIQETFFSMLTEVTERAMAHMEKKEAVLIGGVAANKRLVEMLTSMCSARKSKFYAVPLKYAADNAAMIGWQGLLEYGSGKRTKIPDINPNERPDQVEVTWL